MNARDKMAVESMFGKATKSEKVRTSLLFTKPYGSITVPDVGFDKAFVLCVARVPDEKFYQLGYWHVDGPRPSDDDPDAFIVPVVVSVGQRDFLGNWQRVAHGEFVTTRSGVVVLDAQGIFAWEGYAVPGKRDYGFDKRRLERSFDALRRLACA